MTAATPSRFGAINGGVDKDALFLKVFSGEVMAAFARSTQIMDKHMVRTITSGKSAQFPAMGRTTASYHTPGAEILGKSINSAERIITIDDILISDVFLAEIDEAKTHYDVRSVYSSEMGQALALQFDKHVFQTAILASRATATVTGLPDGQDVQEATAGDFDDGAKLAAAIFDAAQILDENDVPKEGRYAFVPWSRYYAMVQATANINKDWGGAGAFSDGTIFRVAGIPIIGTNNLPSTNITTGVEAGTGTRYAGNFTNTKGLVMHSSAVGTVKLMDLSMEMNYDFRRLGTLMVGKYAVGHGILRPEAAVELTAAA